MNPDYLRRQAEICLRIARACFDLAAAERLRLMAADLSAKADEAAEQVLIEPQMMSRNGNSNSHDERKK